MACRPPPMSSLMSPAMPGSPQCCWPSWRLAAPSVFPQLQRFLHFPVLASSTTFMYTTCSKAFFTPPKGCLSALSSLSLFVLPKFFPYLLGVFILSLTSYWVSSVVAETPFQRAQHTGCLGGDNECSL